MWIELTVHRDIHNSRGGTELDSASENGKAPEERFPVWGLNTILNNSLYLPSKRACWYPHKSDYPQRKLM
jgi:hypothetical protein